MKALHRKLSFFVSVILSASVVGCSTHDSKVPLRIPRGYVSTLEVEINGRLCRFGPFVGYYFRPVDPADLTRLKFVCFNERLFYTNEQPANAMLFRGDGQQVTLPETGPMTPSAEARMQPVFFRDAPQAWLETRPAPKDEFVHFHSCYDALGAVRHGYWLRHDAVAAFTYDMGGRVGPGSPLYHKVEPGVDKGFARIVEFDRGPALKRSVSLSST
jgi:hypothetical protein